MKVENVAINTLVNDPNNARKHGDKNIMAIKGSLAKFGQQKPIVVNEKNIVVAGNGTLEAARQLGWTDINIVRTDLDGFNADAFALADNRTSELAEWNDDALNATLQALKSVDFDLPAIGFDDFKEFVPDLPDDEEKDKGDKQPMVIVQCKSLDEQQELFDELNERGYKVKV